MRHRFSGVAFGFAVTFFMLTSSTGAEVTPSSSVQKHPWWTITTQQAKDAFNAGTEHRMYQHRPTDPRLSPFNKVYVLIMKRGLGGTFGLDEVRLCTPLSSLFEAGVSANKKSGAEQAEVLDALFPACNSTIRFDIRLSDFNERYSMSASWSFAAETDKGVRLRAVGKPSEMIRPGCDSMGGYVRFRYVAEFAFTGEDGKPAVLTSTKWLKLWIIGPAGRTWFKFWLDGSWKIEEGNLGEVFLPMLGIT